MTQTKNHDDPTIRDLRALVSDTVRERGVENAARAAKCSPRTISRVLRGENVTIRTVARIMKAHGVTLRLSAESREKPQ